ncbi:MAG: TolC family protein [Armatimonadetes bacterium]|nr:TolC family protein [Armatimonadota bacterium]
MTEGRRRAAGALGPALAFTLMLNGVPVVLAQAPAPAAPTIPPAPNPGGANAPGNAAAPAPNAAPAPGLTALPTATVIPPAGAVVPTSGTATARTLTLADVVNLAIRNNPTAILAQQRLQKAQELINQVNAQAQPQITANVVDTYSSTATFGTQGAAVSNPTLPGGGVIPTITDAGGGNTSALTTGGGGGTTGSTGTAPLATANTTPAPFANSTAGAINTTGTSTGTAGSTSGTGTTGTTGTGTTGTGTTGGGTFGTTGPGTTSTGGAGAQAVALDEVPPIARQYAAVLQAPTASADTAQSRAAPRAPSGGSGGSGSGTGTTTTTGTTVPTGFGAGSSGQHNNYSGRASVTQYIDIFGLLPAARDIERTTRDFYAIDLVRVSNEIALTAKDDFFNVLRDQAQVTVDQQQVAAATENLRITQAKFSAGASPQFDVLTAQVTLSNDQQALSSARNSLNLALANLNNLLGLDPGTPLNLTQPPLPPLDQPVDLAGSTGIALRQRPELRQADNNIRIAQRLVRLAGDTLLPTLGLSANADYAGNVTTGTPHDTYSVSAQLTVPLYDGGYTRSQVRSARVDLQTQLTTRDQLQQNVTLEVRQAYLNIQDAQTRASSATVATQQAAEAARIAGVRYQNGLGTIYDLINAQVQLATAQINELNAQYDYQTALAQLVRAVGSR